MYKRQVPESGERFDVWDLPVEIESIENGKLLSVIVTPPDVEEPGEREQE